MDEASLPILLFDLLRREAGAALGAPARWWPMLRRSARFIAAHGPVTQQDRWEEDGGYSPFTLATEIAALLVAADVAEEMGETRAAAFLRETADSWNDSIERWIYTTGTDLARQIGVSGYYVRIAPPDCDGAASPLLGFVPIKNRPPGQNLAPVAHLISPDSLALVRFGLRAADDPRIVDTVKVIDALLRVRLPQGPCWYRYNGDGYGEHEDGSPFDGTGVGRPWPLLAGERAHYELAAGRRHSAEELMLVIEASSAGASRLIPEQVWDASPLPDLELFPGKPSGSACPLVWAHAEYVKLRRSLRDGRIFDQPRQTVERYQVEKRTSPSCTWRFNNKCRTLPRGKKLRIVVLAPAIVRWSVNEWQTATHTPTEDIGWSIHLADLPTEALPPGGRILFTFLWPENNRWEGSDFAVTVE